MGNLTKDFSSGDFECPCGCGESRMNAKFMTKLQTFKDVMNMPISIVKGSAYMCEDHAKSKNKLNVEGKVAMPKINKDCLFKAVSVAISVGFTGIGIKSKNGQVSLHLDDAARTQPEMWTL